MSSVQDISREINQALFSDEFMPVIFLIFIGSYLGDGKLGAYLFVIAGIFSSIILILYLFETRSISKFFWVGLAVSGAVMLYASLPDPSTIYFSSNYTADGIFGYVLVVSICMFNGYTAEKYLGNAGFMMVVSEKVYDRNLLLLSPQSSIVERFFVVTCTDDLNLLDMTRLTNINYVFAFKSKSKMSLLTIESKEGFSSLISLVREGGKYKESYCSRCGDWAAFNLNHEPSLENQVNMPSRFHKDLCEDCIRDLLKLAVDKNTIDESELYAQLV